MSEDCTVLNISCLQADLQDVFLNPHLFAVTQVYHNITWAATQATRIFLKFNHAFLATWAHKPTFYLNLTLEAIRQISFLYGQR